jgi:hypothetical protein
MPLEEVLPNRLVQDVALLLFLELLLPLSDGEPNDKGLAVVWLPPLIASDRASRRRLTFDRLIPGRRCLQDQ